MDLPEFAFNMFDKSVVRDPYPVYDKMREAGRVLRSGPGPILVHKFEDVRRINGDAEAFSMGALGGAMPGMQGTSVVAQTMLTTDPPDHERLRGVVAKAFTPRSIAALEPRVREIADELLEPLRSGEPFDIVADFAAPLPTIVISELMGVPAEDGERFRRWTSGMTGTDMRNRGDARRNAGEFTNNLRGFFAEIIERKRADPSDDLIGRMVVANEDGSMSDDELVASCILLLGAGNETTMRLIANMTLALDAFPEQRERLNADRSLMANAVEETLRYDGPVQMSMRGAKQDAAVGDVPIDKGQMVLVVIGAANRDPDAFDTPDSYDVGREDITHVAFGHGIHYCLGAPLARRETKIAFEALLDVAPNFRVLTPREELEYSGFLRSPRSAVVSA